MSDDLNVKAGTFITFETGEYSDYSYTGPFIVIKDFNRTEVAELYRSTWVQEPTDWRNGPSEDGFVAWMSKNNYIVDVPCSTSWHVGCYGRFEP